MCNCKYRLILSNITVVLSHHVKPLSLGQFIMKSVLIIRQSQYNYLFILLTNWSMIKCPFCLLKVGSWNLLLILNMQSITSAGLILSLRLACSKNLHWRELNQYLPHPRSEVIVHVYDIYFTSYAKVWWAQSWHANHEWKYC